MKCVIIGDIGWEHFYHLGDEAMTEVAIEQLQQRGATDITLVAGNPTVSEKFYGVPAVSRFGFSARMSREQCDQKLNKISSFLTGLMKV